MTDEQRTIFDEHVEVVIASLPPHVREVLDEVPVIVADRPDEQVLRELGLEGQGVDDEQDLLGLHSGFALTERSIERTGELPSQIHIFREGVIRRSGGWPPNVTPRFRQRLERQIRITLLHEIGHQMGLDEDELSELGYE